MASHQANKSKPHDGIAMGLNFELPELVESQRQRWIRLSQVAAFTSTVLCIVSTRLISNVKSGDLGSVQTGLHYLLLILSYSAFALNMSAGISAFIMLDRLGDMVQRSKRRFDAGDLPPSEVGYDHLLEDFGVGSAFKWMRNHCELFEWF
ncbi:hypothetical protein FRB96_009137 [Tulasnella sp. 330]|nr:hypothetical protein FRB96_009137 [Tulasnella sp. 330]KAG8877892.1 hypothetical protein FRB97_002926 [Tulasnella sp. 331]KAG8886888.1 hypothetical protein FRB98_000804 [Tulasnella sp. 332]